MAHLEDLFTIARPALSNYAAVSHPSLIVEAYHSAAGEMSSHGGLHRISVNRTAHGRYSFRLGDGGRTHTVARPRNMLCLQPATIPLFVDGDAAEYISIFLAPEVFRRAAPETLRPEERDGRSLLVPTDPVTLHLALALAETTRRPEAADPLVAEQLGLALSACVARLLATRSGMPSHERRHAISPHRLRRVLDYIEASLGDSGLSLERLAAIAELSPFHFSRAFKSATGTAPHRFVIERRIERAKLLLATRELPLAEIAYATGFASQAHFSTMFRRAMEMTPGAYRQASGRSERDGPTGLPIEKPQE